MTPPRWLFPGFGSPEIPAIAVRPLAAVSLAAALLVAGCGGAPARIDAPWKDTPDLPATEEPRATADAAGVFPGCPVTVAEVRAAVPDVTGGPDVGIPFKSVTENCTFSSGGVYTGGHPAGISILVFDAEGAGVHLWDSVRTDPSFPNQTAIAGLGDDAFVTGTRNFTDLWAVKNQVGLHVMTDRDQGLTAGQFAALARAAFDRLEP